MVIVQFVVNTNTYMKTKVRPLKNIKVTMYSRHTTLFFECGYFYWVGIIYAIYYVYDFMVKGLVSSASFWRRHLKEQSIDIT